MGCGSLYWVTRSQDLSVCYLFQSRIVQKQQQQHSKTKIALATVFVNKNTKDYNVILSNDD